MPNWIGFVLGFCLISDSYPVYKEIHFLFFRINKLYLISLMGWRILIFFVYEINTFFGAMLVITTIENYSIMSVFLLSQCTSVLMTSMYRSLSPHQFVRLGLFCFFFVVRKLVNLKRKAIVTIFFILLMSHLLRFWCKI